MRNPLLFLGLLTAWCPLHLSAQTDSTQLPAVIVTATPIPSPLPRVGRHLQVLDSTAIQGAVSPSAAEILRSRTLVDVRQRGPFDAQTDISMRGGTFDQALVLVDGIPMSDPQTGHHQMDLPLVMDAVDRIEVLYGGASRTFGAGAFSGAVNLVTRPPLSDRGQLVLDGGSYGSYRGRLLQDVKLGGTGLRIAGLYAHSDGYVPDSDQDQYAGQAEVYHAWGKNELRVQAGHASKRFGAQNFYSSLYPQQYEETGIWTANTQLRHTGPELAWTAQLYGRRHDDRFELFREGYGYYHYSDGFFVRGTGDTARFGPTAFYTFHNRHRTDVAGAEVTAKRAWGTAGTTAIGLHGRYERILSNVLGTPLPEPIHVPGERDPFTRSDERRNVALSVDHRYERGRWSLDGGMLINVNSSFVPQWAPGVDAVYRWNDAQRSFLSLGRSFRFPTWTDLYYNRGGAVGSADLGPEHADQVELGHRWSRGTFGAKGSVWYRQGHDLIDWVVLPGETTVHATNITALNVAGVDLELTVVHAKVRYGALYAYQASDRTAFAYRSLYVLDHLRHTAVLWADVDLGKGFRLKPELSWRERVGTYVRFSDGSEQAYPDPLRVDLRVEWTRKTLTLFASGYNLLDAEQMDRGNVPLPGRWLTGGLQWRWGKQARPQ